MRIDGAVNYSSFMQHYNPLDVRPVADASSEQSASVAQAGVVSSVKSAAPVKPEASPSNVITEGVRAGRSPYKNTAVEDIEVDFTSGIGSFKSGDIRKAISGMEKDSMLHEYQYFIGNRRAETLVDNSDGMVVRLGS